MPKMKMSRTFILETTSGCVIRFEKGVATNVPMQAYEMAVKFGAEPCSDEDKVEIKKSLPEAPEDANTRRPLIIAKMREMVARNLRGDFTASGTPNTKVLEKLLGDGWQVSIPERDSCWAELRLEMNPREQVASNAA